MATIGGAAYYYYTSTQSRITELTQANATLTANLDTALEANRQNVATINQLQEEFERVQRDFQTVQAEFQIIREQNAELRERLGRHELDVLAAARPGLVERTINNASINALRCFELLSGAPLNERERTAENARAFNSECPWLFEELR